MDPLQFLGANDVYLNGYVWQGFSAASIAKHRPGVIFPNSVGRMFMKESYKHTIDGDTVIGWYFAVNLR